MTLKKKKKDPYHQLTFFQKYEKYFFVLALYFVMRFSQVQMEGFLYRDFIGIVLAFAALLKFFDFEGFTETFATYDFIAVRYYVYGYIYPFLELLLAIAYFAKWHFVLTDIALFFFMSISAIGIIFHLIWLRKPNVFAAPPMPNPSYSVFIAIKTIGLMLMALYSLFM